jgi:hypothetical protein
MALEQPATTLPRETVFEALTASVQGAAAYNREDVVPPAAILWTDERREWESLGPRLRVVLPQFLVLGPYDKANRVGPAIWLRCVLAGRVPDVTIAPDLVPIIYLPGVSHPTLRATEDCPPELRPLAEWQYRGVFWSQYNGKDWTIAAFLQSDRGGLGLDVARDRATAASIRRALGRLLDVPVVDLRAKATHGPLESEDFDAFISDDPVDDLLTWLSDPKGTLERSDTSQWDTLCSRCKSDYDFDPVKDGELVGAERLGSQAKPAWQTAWKRFAAMPSRYPGLVDLLRKAKPSSTSGDLLASLPSEAWPQDNEAEEAELRQALHELPALPVAKASAQLRELEQKHGMRRSWVWAKLGRTPLAQAIHHLSRMAEVTKTPLTGASAADLIDAYTTQGWRADAAVLDSLAAVTSHDDRAAVCAAIRHVYAPWLRDAAELFQQRAAAMPLPGRESPRLDDVPTGTCLLFVDGLRFDVGQKLQEALQGRVGGIELTSHTAALPTVTATAKPAVSPVAHHITGLTAGEDFCPSVTNAGKDLTTDRFRALLEDAGFQVLSGAELGDPEGKAWAEYGNLDHIGHQESIGLARRIPELLTDLVARIESLLVAGWREVRVVTDHGWLLVPGGLPKAELPKYLTVSRWGRCAVVKTSAQVDLPCYAWFWSEHVRVASPHGIDCFIAGKEYDHGGLSLQECVVSQLSIRARQETATSASIASVRWVGLRCRVHIHGQATGYAVDLRDKVNAPDTSLTGARPVGPDGAVALVVDDDAREGTAAMLVLIDSEGTVVDKTAVTVGA